MDEEVELTYGEAIIALERGDIRYVSIQHTTFSDDRRSCTCTCETDGKTIYFRKNNVLSTVFESVGNTVERLFIYDISFNPKSALLLGKMLKKNKSIKQFELVCNNYGDSGLQYIIGSLSSNTSVETFGIGQPEFSEYANYGVASLRMMVEPLCAMLKINTTIRNLEIEYCRIDDNCAEQIGKMLKINDSIESISLGRNCFESPGLQSICDGLENNKSVYKLNLAKGTNSDDELEIIGKMLMKNKTLRELDLSTNGIRKIGGLFLDDECSIEKLILRDNYIGYDVGPLCKVLKNNYNLVLLNLAGNRLTTDAINDLCEALIDNTNLQSANFAINDAIDYPTAQTINKLLRKNQTLTEFSLHIDECENLKIVCDGLRENYSIQHLFLDLIDLYNEPTGEYYPRYKLIDPSYLVETLRASSVVDVCEIETTHVEYYGGTTYDADADDAQREIDGAIEERKTKPKKMAKPGQ